MFRNKNLIKILIIVVLLLAQSRIKINSEYTPQPILLIHGRGMHSGNNWDAIKNETGGTLLDYLSSYGVIYYYGSFSGSGYGAIDTWGNELVTWVNNFKTAYENRPENPEFTKFRFVSYSAGGLASRWYMANNGIQNIERLITLNTPHQGAYLGSAGEIFNYGGYVFMGLAVTYGLLALNPALSATCGPATAICGIAGGTILALRFIYAEEFFPPFGVLNNIDLDLYPISPFFFKLKTMEGFASNQYKTKYKITSGQGAVLNVGKFQSEAFSAMMIALAVPGAQIAFIPLVLAAGTSLLERNGDFASLVNSQEGTDPYPFGPWYINQSSDFNKVIVKTEKNHFEITQDGKLILQLLDDPPILNVEVGNTLTDVKMEPDGCYVNIQNPIIHLDGSCDDYLIQWMGENDRVRLRYDDFANIDEVVKLKNTEEGDFDYQRNGDVGRGWFSQKHSLKLGGENKIKLVAKNAGDNETI